LSRQAAFLGGTTERLFRAAGLEPGMRVLDVGSGAGDVALLAAEFVGPEGEVVGVDVDGAALKVARGRAHALGLRNVSFVEGDAVIRRRIRPHAGAVSLGEDQMVPEVLTSPEALTSSACVRASRRLFHQFNACVMRMTRTTAAITPCHGSGKIEPPATPMPA
jgi:SAM-dependent methyltransferase